MNQKHHKDWWPLSKQTVICFLVISHSCYRFLYNSGSQNLYKKYWCGLTAMPVPFEWMHRPLLESSGNGMGLAFTSLLTAMVSTHTKEKKVTVRETESDFANFTYVKRWHLTGSGEAERYHGAAAESCSIFSTGGAWQQRVQMSL